MATLVTALRSWQRCHDARMDGSIGTDGVPSLPDRRRSTSDLIQPGWRLATEEREVRLLEVAGRGQCREHQGRPEESRRNPPVRGSDERGEGVTDDLTLIVRNQPELDRHSAARLIRDEVLAPAGPRRRPDSAGYALVAGRVVGGPDERGRARGEASAVGEEGVRQVGRIRSCLPGTIRRSRRIQPVAELEGVGQQAVRAASTKEGFDPAAHARVLVANDGDIAIRLIDGPRHDGGRVRPARSPEPRLALKHDIRDHGRHPHHRVLIKRKVAQPACPERLCVEQGAGRRREGLGVSGPTETLVPLRAVRRDRDEVVPLGPDDVFVKPVQVRVGGLERASPRGRAADRHVRGIDDVRIGFDLGVPKAMEREHRLQDDGLVIGEDVGIGRSCRSEGAGMQGSVRLEDLGVPHRDPLVASAPDAYPHVAGHVLTSVRAKQPGSDLDRRHGDRGGDANRRSDARLEDPAIERHLHHLGPGRVLEFRHLPAVLLLAEIDLRPVVQVCGPDRAGRRSPLAVRRDRECSHRHPGRLRVARTRPHPCRSGPDHRRDPNRGDLDTSRRPPHP